MLSHIRTALEQMGKDKLPDRSGQSLAFEAMWRGLPPMRELPGWSFYAAYQARWAARFG